MTKLIVSEIDKANHFIVGYLIYFLSCVFLSPFLATLPVIIIAALKEVVDMWRYKRTFDWKDFVYTIAGMVPALILLLIK